jgi:putative transposase
MSNYRRAYVPGGTYFFTLVTHHRRRLLQSPERVTLLREAMRHVNRTRPFKMQAAVILPDHLHCIMTLPEGDSDYSGRWREIKKRFSRQVDTSTNARGERPVWQRRFYEHVIRDEDDWKAHVDYIHYNPVKHGLAKCPRDWPWSSFTKALRLGWYTEQWGCDPVSIDLGDELA